MKWEYYVSDDETRLPELGEQGWELVTVVPHNDQLKFYLKKQKRSLKEQMTEEQRQEVYRELNPEDIK